jgi:hypothetical protein
VQRVADAFPVEHAVERVDVANAANQADGSPYRSIRTAFRRHVAALAALRTFAPESGAEDGSGRADRRGAFPNAFHDTASGVRWCVESGVE